MKKLFAIVAVMGVLTFGSTNLLRLKMLLLLNKQNKLLLQHKQLLLMKLPLLL